MKYYFEINGNTLPVITVLNGGVVPVVNSETMFVFDPDPEGYNDIIPRPRSFSNARVEDAWDGSEIILLKNNA